jgi:hypothetical protein
MTIAEAVAKSVESLPPEKQEEVLDFVEFVRSRPGPHRGGALKSIRGIWKDSGIQISDEDLRQARREMWRNFPREMELQ